MWNVAHGVGDRDRSAARRASARGRRSGTARAGSGRRCGGTRRTASAAASPRASRRRRRAPCACAAGRAARRARARTTAAASRGETSSPHANARPRHAALVERVVEPLCVAARVERENARVDAALAQRGQQREEVLLGAADALHLDQVQDLHRAGSLRRARSMSSTMRAIENRSRIRSRAGSPSAARSAGSSAQLARARAASAVDVADRRERARLAVVDDACASRRRRSRRPARRRRAPRSRRPARPRSPT